MLQAENSLFLIIDVQEKLIHAVKEDVIPPIAQLAQGCNLLNVPIFISQQYPKGLGLTDAKILAQAPNAPIIDKTNFSIIDTPLFDMIQKSGKKQIIIAGIETHICVFQSALDLKNADYDVFILQEGVASRNPNHTATAINIMQSKNISAYPLEMILFSWLKSSNHPQFKAIQSLIK